MKYFGLEEIEFKLDYLEGILAMPVDKDSDIIVIKHHLLDLANAQSTLVRLMPSAKILYNKDKKNEKYILWWEHAQSLQREFSHKLSVLQSVLKVELEQFKVEMYKK